MQIRRLSIAMFAAAACLPATARAADAYSPLWWIYSINQVCQAWSDGVARCFPVALVGPAPTWQGRPLTHLMPTPPQPAAPQRPANPYLAYTAPYAGAPQPVVAAPSAYLAPPVQAAAVVQPAAATPPAPTTASAPVPAPSPLAQPAGTATPEVRAVAVAPAEKGAVRLDALTHFEFDKAELTDAARATLDAWLPSLLPGMRLNIAGHADRFGSNRYNLALSRRRAENVARYLGDKGMRPNDIHVAALGETVPLVKCEGGPTPEIKACLAPNRRVEIRPE